MIKHVAHQFFHELRSGYSSKRSRSLEEDELEVEEGSTSDVVHGEFGYMKLESFPLLFP